MKGKFVDSAAIIKISCNTLNDVDYCECRSDRTENLFSGFSVEIWKFNRNFNFTIDITSMPVKYFLKKKKI